MASERAPEVINRGQRQTLPATFGGRQAITAVRFHFFPSSLSKLESVDKCLSLNHPPATGSSNYSELPHPAGVTAEQTSRR